MIAELTRRAHDELGDEATPLDYAESWVASGRTILALADELSAAIGEKIMREVLSHYLNEQENAETRLTRARARGAHAMVETAVQINDDGGETREELQHAKMRSDVRLWIAERWNRDELGARNGPQINVSIGALHLDALRVREVGTAVAAALPAPSVIATDIAEEVEVLSADEAMT